MSNARLIFAYALIRMIIPHNKIGTAMRGTAIPMFCIFCICVKSETAGSA